MPATILGPSERGADYCTITYERSGSMVMCPYSTDVRYACGNTPTTHLSSAPNRSQRRLTQAASAVPPAPRV